MESEPKEDPLKKVPQQAPEEFKRIKIDTYVGMAFSNLVAYFIILTQLARFAFFLRPFASVFSG
jgi:hypothetical protein